MARTLDGVISWAEAHSKTPHGADWDGYCEMFVADAGGYTNAFPTAHADYRASHVYTPSQLPLSKVPDGWLLFWDYVGSDGQNYGHVAFKKGSRALMASSYVTDPIHNHLGWIDAASYQTRSGHRYLGASPDHGGQYLSGIAHTPPSSNNNTVKKPPVIVYTLSTGTPNSTFWKRLQWYGHLNGYTGPIDGVMGVLSWKGVQRGLTHYGYTGVIDGEPGPLTFQALQRMASKFGYSGPIDGQMGANSWKGVARRLNKL